MVRFANSIHSISVLFMTCLCNKAYSEMCIVYILQLSLLFQSRLLGSLFLSGPAKSLAQLRRYDFTYSCLPNKRGATAIYLERFFHATRSY